MEIIEQIQTWYAAQCNGDWEHQYGISMLFAIGATVCISRCASPPM
jgi:hypothetical protein